MHRLDRPAERDRPGPLRDGQPADRLRVVGHPALDGARVERDRGRPSVSDVEERPRSARAPGRSPACGRPGRTAGPRRPPPPPGAAPTTASTAPGSARRGRPGAGSCRSRPRRPTPGSPMAASTRARSAATATSRAVGQRRPRLRAGRRSRRARRAGPRTSGRPRSTPAAARARNSPLLWPTTASGREPEPDQELIQRPLRREDHVDRRPRPTRAPGPGRPGRRRGARSARSAPRPRGRAGRRCRTGRGPRGSAGRGRRASRDTATPRPGTGRPAGAGLASGSLPEVGPPGVADRPAGRVGQLRAGRLRAGRPGRRATSTTRPEPGRARSPGSAGVRG